MRSIAPTGVCIRAVTDGIRDWSHRTSWRPAGRSTPTGTGRSRTRGSPASTTAARSTGRSAGARRRPPGRLQDAPGVWDIDRERLSADRHGVKVAAAWSARLRARNRGRAGLRALGSDQVKSPGTSSASSHRSEEQPAGRKEQRRMPHRVRGHAHERDNSHNAELWTSSWLCSGATDSRGGHAGSDRSRALPPKRLTAMSRR